MTRISVDPSIGIAEDLFVSRAKKAGLTSESKFLPFKRVERIIKKTYAEIKTGDKMNGRSPLSITVRLLDDAVSVEIRISRFLDDE